MSKDRIKDLQTNTPRPSVSYRRLSQLLNHEDHQTEGRTANNHSTTINIDNESNVTDFLKEIDSIRSIIDKIDERTEQVKQLHIDMLKPMANPKLEQRLDDKTEEIKKLAYEVSTKLRKMEQSKENRNDPDKINAQWRIKESQIFVLTRRFRDTMTQYNRETESHRDRCKKVIVRELEISGARKSDDELEDMLASGFPGTFNCSILVDIQKSKQSLNEIEARHRDIIKLENSIRDLHNMYMDLARLVSDQGEMIDCIEHNVLKAVDYIEDAAGDVNDARQYQKKAMKKRIIIILILISIAVILMIIFLGYFTQKKLKGR